MDFIQPILPEAESKDSLYKLGVDTVITEVGELEGAPAEDIIKEIQKARIWLEKQAGGMLTPQSNFPGWQIMFRDDEVKDAFREHCIELSTLYAFVLRDKDPGTVIRMEEIERYLRWCIFSGLLALPLVQDMLYPWSIDDDVHSRAWSHMITGIHT